jgi:hypothetical protein
MRKNRQVAADSSTIDPGMERAIDKLSKRETTRIGDMHLLINGLINAFEAKYKMSSEHFQSRYDCEHEASLSGSIGDDMDFIEWAATPSPP